MAVYNPMYNEETGWAALDSLTPAQQAFMNPGAFGAGYNNSPMQMDLINQVNNQGTQNVNNMGGGNNWFGAAPTNPFLSPATAAQIQPGVQGTSAATPTIASPSLLANNMGMQGAESVGGVGMYTGANAPLNMSLFAPQGIEAAMMNGSMGGFGEALFKAAQGAGLNPNTSYLGFMDDLSRRALQAKGGGGGLLPQDFVNYLQSQGGQQWINSQRAQPQPPMSQTGPATPPVAPLPPQQTNPTPQPTFYDPGNPGAGRQNPSMDSRQRDQMNPPASFRAEYDSWQNRGGQQTPVIGSPSMMGSGGLGPSLNGYQTEGDMYDARFGRGAAEFMAQQEQARVQDIISRLGLKSNPRQGYQFQDLAPDPLGIGVDRRDYTMADGSPVDWNALARQYGNGAFTSSQMNRRGTNGFNAPSQYVPGSFLNQPGQPGQNPYQTGGQGQPYGNQQYPQGYGQQPQYNYNDLTDYGRQQMGLPTQQQAAPDFRATTYGGPSQAQQAPQTSGGSTASTPSSGFNYSTLNPSASTASGPGGMWGNTTGRRQAFGNTSLFGNYGQPAQTGGSYGGGQIGRPASMGGQSYRPAY